MNHSKKSNYDKFPNIKIDGQICIEGWKNIIDKLREIIKEKHSEKIVIAIECYHGVYTNEVFEKLQQGIPEALLLDASSCINESDEIEKMVHPFVTDDPVFGYMAPLNLTDFFSIKKIKALQNEINAADNGIYIVYGIGASIIAPAADLLFYADMPRWEIQLRFRSNRISNLGAQNQDAEFSYQYKRSFFVDWRVCDRHKKATMHKWDYVLDTTLKEEPKLFRQIHSDMH